MIKKQTNSYVFIFPDILAANFSDHLEIFIGKCFDIKLTRNEFLNPNNLYIDTRIILLTFLEADL